MTNLQPLSLALRNEVKKFLEHYTNPGDRLLLAISGGYDSIALCHIMQSLHQEHGVTFSTLTVDHSLQELSSDWTRNTVAHIQAMGVREAESVQVKVDIDSPEGLEAAARAARYEALQTRANEIGARAILLAHTLDDQAETVLLRLAQGASTNSIAAMRQIQGNLWRPLLNVRRSTLREYLSDFSLEAIDDPHNHDSRFTRVRVREELMPNLIDVLGKDVVKALATTARLAAIDADTLDFITDSRYADVVLQGEVQCELLKRELPAIQHRIIHRWLSEQGSPRCSNEHVKDALRLASESQLKGPLRVPGIEIVKESGTLRAVRS
jgi:tRNA(Ile)-lysidine synthase